MKYFLIAGEASGDLHGSTLVRHLMKVDKEAVIECWGGDRMEAEGAKLLKHYRDHAIMGFWEVLVNFNRIIRNLKLCKRQIYSFKPDVVILIDYPGFNLRIARFLKENKIRSYYYISPKVWAWKESRVEMIRRFIDRMYIIFPFEVEFYRKHDINAIYYGNPLVETVKMEMDSVRDPGKFRTENQLDDRPVIALLAGSRQQEIKLILPQMIKIKKYYSDYQFVIAGISSVPVRIYEKIIGDEEIRIVFDQTFQVLSASQMALVTSGTATLETALAGIPQIVCYKASPLTYQVAKRFLKLRFISLVNLIMDKEIVKELIQHDLNERNLISEINTLLPGGWKREVMLNNYKRLSSLLKGDGTSGKIASDVFQTLMMVNNVN
ncbi:MAG TPA: lipid-A-disaccharide synthase [Bacteroidales bacterium]|nr:lipid-A-disaccharide synthase [Bacteroidales bacterium]